MKTGCGFAARKRYQGGGPNLAAIGLICVGLILFFVCVPFWLLVSLIGLILVACGVALLSRTT